MKWFWKVRVYGRHGYRFTNIETIQDLGEIICIQDSYERMTGCRMILEGMSIETPFNHPTLKETFTMLWEENQGWTT